ncbi:MAG: nuclear transport factor 2 family protein [Alphaproteobacteria bacterium]|nr:nuclear transport factor 2 family protein [Alphaproteobacteria bacterium]
MPRATAEQRTESLLDRAEIFYLVRFESLCRDIPDWEGLERSYVPGSPVRTTWFDGPIEEFVPALKAKTAAGGYARHRVFPAKHHQKGERAICESPANISERLTLDGVELDVTSHVRFQSRLVLTDVGWRLNSFEAIYESDSIRPVNPTDSLPIDWGIVNAMRPSYRFFGFCEASRHYDVSQDLLGDDRPDELEAFYLAERHWVATGE